MLATLLAGCTTENQNGEGTEPDPGGNPAVARREVLLSLKNKLALKTESTKADAPIATAEENSISTLDLYVFAAATEDGNYTFQERFAYRADGSELPAGASELELTPGTSDPETTGLLNLKKGLFVKLYCVANQPSPVNPADGQPVADNAFVPLTFTDEGKQGTGIATPGQPDEATFLSFHTPLLRGDAAADILQTPLAMSGAYTTPIDLTDFNSSARLQAAFKLTRLAARFDIVNKADESRFTIEQVSMGNGRRGATFFPIRIYGQTPTANADDLITYPERAFDGGNANNGTQTGAFYAYPSPLKDNGFIILKGKYRINQTESEQVTYQVPFVQQAPDGSSTAIEINNNHRYTIGITKADDYHLDFTLSVDDWADDGSIDDYEPENGNGEVTIDIPAAFDGDTQYDRPTKTVTMSLRDGSAFDAILETTSAITMQKTYAGGLEAQQYDWLDIADPQISIMSRATASKYTYTFNKKPGYTKSRFPRATVRFTNVIDGSETLLFVEAIAAPQPAQTPQTEGNRNTFDPDLLEATLYRVTGSQVKVKIVCLDGTTVAAAPDWLDVQAVEQETTSTIYRLTLKEDHRDAEVPENKGTVTFKNSRDATLLTDITVKLLDASIAPNFEALGGTGNTFTPASGSTPANVSMQFSKSNTFAVSSFSLDGVKIGMDFASGPAWLKNNGIPVTRAGSTPNDITFTVADDVLATATAQPEKATVTLKNTSGGKDYTFTVTPVFQAPATAVVEGSASSTHNSFSNNAMTLYRIPESSIKIKASCPGGSVIEAPVGVTITGDGSYATDNEYKVTWDGTTTTDGSFYIVNKSDANKKTKVTVTLADATIAPDFSKLGGTNNSYEAPSGNTPGNVNMQVSDNNAFTVSSLSLDGVKIDTNFDGGPAWLSHNGEPALRSGTVPNKIMFTVNATELATGLAKKATVTLKNTSGGPDYKFTVTPKFLVPATTLVDGSNSPAQNGISGTTITLYQTTGSKIQLKVSGLGGSAIQDAVGVTIDGSGGYGKENTYTVTLADNTTTSGSFTVVNKSDPTKKTAYTLNVPLYKTPTYTADSPSPSQNNLAGSAIKIYKVSNSSIRIKASSVGGNYIKSSTGVTVSGSGGTAQDNYYTVTWDGSASTGSLVIANKSDDRRETTLGINFPSAALSSTTATTILAKYNTSNNLNITAPEGITASVTNWNGGQPWFTITNNAQSGNGIITLVQGDNRDRIIKPATIKLTNNISGGGDKEITVTPRFDPELSTTSVRLENVVNESTSSTITIGNPTGGYTIVNDNSNNFTARISGGTLKVEAKKTGNNLSFKVVNQSDASVYKTISVTVVRDYNGRAVYRVGNTSYYVAPEDKGDTQKWSISLSDQCSLGSHISGNNLWVVPDKNQMNYIIDNGNAPSLFPSGNYWLSCKSQVQLYYYSNSSDRVLDSTSPSVFRHIRCIITR